MQAPMSNNFYRLVLYRTRQLFNWTMVNLVNINQFVAVAVQSPEKLVENFCGLALAKFNSKTGQHQQEVLLSIDIQPVCW